MKKLALQIAALAGLLLLVCIVSRLAVRNTYTAYIPIPPTMADVPAEQFRFVHETPGVVAQGQPRRQGDYLRVPIRAQRPGETYIDVGMADESNLSLQHFRVGRFGTVYDISTGGFTGDSVVLTALTLFFLAVAVLMFRFYRRSQGPAFYAYSTIYAVGFALFCLLTGLFMLSITARHLLHPYAFSMLAAYDVICGASLNFVLLTAPLMLAFATAMAVSNIALLRHERLRMQNVLGIGIAVILAAGVALAAYLYARNFSGSQLAFRIHNTVQNVYGTAFAYFECMLIGAVVCGLKAARHVPAPDADYILILGCRFRKDGTLTPLLQGRVDRAIQFWRQQRAAGKQAVLMPSGGQGTDEPIAEAEAMRRYLVQQGIPETAILVEDRSRNTYQNMAFSKALIEDEHPGAKVVYATTNYHVFRSGVWASLAGLPAEGMGSRTKWWYWPNAFMRECVGLMMNRIPQEIALLLVLIAFFGTLSMVLS